MVRQAVRAGCDVVVNPTRRALRARVPDPCITRPSLTVAALQDRVKTVNPTLKRILKPSPRSPSRWPCSSAMVLVFVGTSAQKEMGIWDVQHRYFHSLWCWVPVKYFFPLSDWSWDHVKGHFPFPGGYTLIAALLVNLLAAHSVRFKFTWKRSGVLLIHSGLILLLLGEFATSKLAVESQMPIEEGNSSNWTQDIRAVRAGRHG